MLNQMDKLILIPTLLNRTATIDGQHHHQSQAKQWQWKTQNGKKEEKLKLEGCAEEVILMGKTGWLGRQISLLLVLLFGLPKTNTLGIMMMMVMIKANKTKR